MAATAETAEDSRRLSSGVLTQARASTRVVRSGRAPTTSP